MRLFLLMAVSLSLLTVGAEKAFDVMITNGRVIDGSGSPWYRADVGIRDGKIVAIGRLADAAAKKKIDAAEQIVAPGFIDMLGQSEYSILVEPTLPSKIFQGITTEITGEGDSVAPLTDEMVKADRDYYAHYRIKADWRTFAQYFRRLEKQGIGINIGTYVGATQIRRVVLGSDNKEPTAEQLEKMRRLVRESMEDGALGVSSALIYSPAIFAKTPELIALASEAARYGGLYASHIRNEGDTIMEALDEAFSIARSTKIPLEIWHLKAAGKPNWGRMPEIVSKINSARAAGIDVAADTYGYTASFNGLASYTPPWAQEGGNIRLIERLKDPATRARIREEMLKPAKDWENEWLSTPGPEAILIGVVRNPELKNLQGKNLAQIAELWKQEPLDAFLDLLVKDAGFVQGARFSMSEIFVAEDGSYCVLPVGHGRWGVFKDGREYYLQPRGRRRIRGAGAMDFVRLRFSGSLAHRSPRPESSSPPRIWNLSSNSPEVCPRRKTAYARKRHPQNDQPPCAKDAPCRPRFDQGRTLG